MESGAVAEAHPPIRVDDEITLRPPSLEDAETLFALIDANREYIRRWLPPLAAIATVDQERRWIAERLAADDGHRPFLIVYRGEIAGAIGYQIAIEEGAVEVGYWLAADRQGRGIATRACAAIVDHIWDAIGAERVLILAAPENASSRAIPERLGFRLERIASGVSRATDAEMAVYVMTASERARAGGGSG